MARQTTAAAIPVRAVTADCPLDAAALCTTAGAEGDPNLPLPALCLPAGPLITAVGTGSELAMSADREQQLQRWTKMAARLCKE